MMFIWDQPFRNEGAGAKTGHREKLAGMLRQSLTRSSGVSIPGHFRSESHWVSDIQAWPDFGQGSSPPLTQTLKKLDGPLLIILFSAGPSLGSIWIVQHCACHRLLITYLFQKVLFITEF